LAGLAPMAVRPDWQKKGVGSRLVEEGLKRCKQSGYGAVVVLGHPDYYPRFGFSPSVNYGIESEYDVPVEVFMVKELRDGALDDCTGRIRYHKAFGNI
jgi:putative acetyltransferase